VNKCKSCGRFRKKDEKYCDVCKQSIVEKVEDFNSNVDVDENEAIGTVTYKQIVATGNTPYNLDNLIDLFEIDRQKWIANNPKINSWDVTTKDGITYRNYQIKVSFVRSDVVWDYEDIRKDFIELCKSHKPKTKSIKYKVDKNQDNNLAEVNIYDAHIGKLCYHAQSGENYDTSIAYDRFMNTLDLTMKRASVFNFNRIVFPVGNDFFNTDNMLGTTTKGTIQVEDRRWQKVYKLGRELLIGGIDFLSQFAPVDVIVVPGNHDFERMFYLGDTLQMFYADNPNVTVNNSEKFRKYYKHGNVLLGYTHGADEKESDLPLLMAQEVPHLWSQSKVREFHLGHLHHRKEIKYRSTKEYVGVVVRYMRSISGTDQWHSQKGYVGTLKGSECFIWNDKTGLVAMMENNIVL